MVRVPGRCHAFVFADEIGKGDFGIYVVEVGVKLQDGTVCMSNICLVCYGEVDVTNGRNDLLLRHFEAQHTQQTYVYQLHSACWEL